MQLSTTQKRKKEKSPPFHSRHRASLHRTHNGAVTLRRPGVLEGLWVSCFSHAVEFCFSQWLTLNSNALGKPIAYVSLPQLLILAAKRRNIGTLEMSKVLQNIDDLSYFVFGAFSLPALPQGF